MAISSEDAEQMMAPSCARSRKLPLRHIGIGIMDYATKDIEIKAEAGTASQTLGRRIASAAECWKGGAHGVSALVQNASLGQLAGVLPESRAGSACPSVMARNCWVCSTSRAARKCVRAAGCSDSEHAGRSSCDPRCTTLS